MKTVTKNLSHKAKKVWDYIANNFRYLYLIKLQNVFMFHNGFCAREKKIIRKHAMNWDETSDFAANNNFLEIFS